MQKDAIKGSHIHRLTAKHFVSSLQRSLEASKHNADAFDVSSIKNRVISLGENWGLARFRRNPI